MVATVPIARAALTTATPAFVIAPAGGSSGVPVHGRVFLSPMAGFSDSPYRRICRRRGSGFAFSEFISAENVRRGADQALALFRYVPEERPVIFQIFGNNADALLYAAQIAEELQPDVLDINMGCSVRTVAHKGSGAGMLRDPSGTAQIFERIVKHLSIPVSAKIRLGWDEHTRNYREMTRALVDAGAAMISVHGRTKMMAYTGVADWDAIGEIAAELPVPVLGNGDVQSLAEAEARRKSSGVDGVLIGRAAIGNPWIFESSASSSGDTVAAPDERAVWGLVIEHLQAMLEFYGPRGLVLFRKHAARYLKRLPEVPAVKNRLLTAEDADAFRSICQERLAMAAVQRAALTL